MLKTQICVTRPQCVKECAAACCCAPLLTSQSIHTIPRTELLRERCDTHLRFISTRRIITVPLLHILRSAEFVLGTFWQWSTSLYGFIWCSIGLSLNALERLSVFCYPIFISSELRNSFYGGFSKDPLRCMALFDASSYWVYTLWNGKACFLHILRSAEFVLGRF